MNETLKAFYYGNLTPCERCMIRGSQAERIMKGLSDADKLLSQSLPPELRPVLDRLTKAQQELDSIVAETSYIDGFKTGARFALDILSDGHENIEPITE
ncbi:DUF6809 family protein [uncultured Alistipes sp.]|uniref:DUF6809 family protein n=1 Tax=uncultured Alistipes sp. TaxID=538949 RepID=UPI00272B56CD|nr:DUF6809 family protein [uncultured Alistipes sp.]